MRISEGKLRKIIREIIGGEVGISSGLETLQILLSVLRAVHFCHWTLHWQVRGESFGGDHELMGKIYDLLSGEIDQLGEKIVSGWGREGADMRMSITMMYGEVLGMTEELLGVEPMEMALYLEEELQQVFRQTYDDLKASGDLSLGMDEFIMSMANAHETNLYVLRARCGVDSNC